MNGFRGNHRSNEPGKKGRKVKAYHHDEASRPCPLHGNIHRTAKGDKTQNVAISNNPSSKTERLFRPVKSLLSVCDPETRRNFRYCSPKNSSSHETIKHQTDSDKFNFNKTFVEKAKPFVAGQTNKIKKLKQCFHSPCNSILQKSRSQTLVKQKQGDTRRDFYNMMPEMPPDEKKYDSGFKWFPTGKLGFKSSDKKECATVIRGESSDIVDGKLFGGTYKSKKEFPVFEFNKETTQFVYSSFTSGDNRRKSQGSRRPSVSQKESKPRKDTKFTPKSNEDQSSSSSVSSDESVYFSNLILQPAGYKDSQSDIPQKKETPKGTKGNAETQTDDSDFPPVLEKPRKNLTVSLQTDSETKIPVQDSMAQTSNRFPMTKNESVQTGDHSEEMIKEIPEKVKSFDSEVTYTSPSEEGMETSAPDDTTDVPRTVSYVIEPVEPQKSEETDFKMPVRKSHSDSELYGYSKSKMVLPPKEFDPKKPLEPTHERGNQTGPSNEPEQAEQSQQTSLQEELSNAVSDLTELKNIIHEYFRRAEPLSDKPTRKVDRETMTDSFALKTSKTAVTNAEAQTTPETNLKVIASARSACIGGQEYQCIELNHLDRAAVLCVCSVCGKEIKRFTIGIATNTDNCAPLYDVLEKSNALGLYNDMLKSAKAPESELTDSSEPKKATAQKAPKKNTQDALRLAAYDTFSSSPTTSVVAKPQQQACNKTRQKGENASSPSSCKKSSQQSSGAGSRRCSPTNAQKPSKENSCTDSRKSRVKSSEFYYPVIIKPFFSKHFARIMDKKFNDNPSDESDSQASKQKRSYDKYFETTNTPAGKKIKQGFEEYPMECSTKETSAQSESGRYKTDAESGRKGFGFVLTSSNEFFCNKHTPTPKGIKLKDVRSRSLSNLFAAKGCHLKPLPINCDEQSFRELFEFGSCKSIRFLKTSEEGFVFNPCRKGNDEPDEHSVSSSNDKKVQATPSRENTPNDEEPFGVCTCYGSDSNDSPDTLPMEEILEEPDEYDWESRPQHPTHGRKSRSFSAYPNAGSKTESRNTFWFGREHKRK